MTRPVLRNRDARRLFLHKHGLGDAPVGPGKGADLQALIERLGFVQVDSVNTVERAHHMILFSRRPRYRPKNLKPLLERDRALFEHWTHDASVIPMAFLPHWQIRFERDAALLASRWKNWRRDGFEEKFDEVLRRIEAHGPACSGDVGEGEQRKSGGWWDWHPSKTALEYLWRSGQLAVCHRQGFQKHYDLAERVFPAEVRDQRPGEAATIDWCCAAALDRLGFATTGELAAFWDTVSTAEAKAWGAEALAQGRVIEIDVQGTDGALRKCLAWPDVLRETADAPDPPPRIRILSPFDPALRDRNRTERLFGFHYRIEIFVPAPKRKYGYYVFPVLERDKLIGRIDMKALRQEDRLNVTAFWPERRVKWSPARQARLEAELERMARFAGVSRVTFADGWLRDG